MQYGERSRTGYLNCLFCEEPSRSQPLYRRSGSLATCVDYWQAVEPELELSSECSPTRGACVLRVPPCNQVQTMISMKRRTLIVMFVALCLLSNVAAQQKYDLLLKGGHVIDPKNKLSAIRDVAIAGGKVA